MLRTVSVAPLAPLHLRTKARTDDSLQFSKAHRSKGGGAGTGVPDFQAFIIKHVKVDLGFFSISGRMQT